MMYSTTDVHPRERFSYWREVATRGYVEHDTLPADRASFNGSVHIASLPGIGVSAFDAAPHQVHRSARSAATANNGELLFHAVTSGEVAVSQDGRDSIVKDRGFYLIDPIRPFDLVLRKRSTHVIIKVPRGMIDARVGNTSDLTGKVMGSSEGVGSITMGLIELLSDRAETLDDLAGLKVAEQLMDLTALTLVTCRRDNGVALSSPRAVALLRLKATIERLLIEPGLKPDRVAAEAGISVRYANDLLSEERSSIERFVTERRLERCRHALEDASQSHRTIGEIAFKWGFSDLSHFGRRFKARYGLSPTDYRRQAMLCPAEPPHDFAV